MSRMLLAYAGCGCLAAAVLDLDDEYAAQAEAGMIRDAKEYGWTLKREERESVGFEPCASHSLPIQGRG